MSLKKILLSAWVLTCVPTVFSADGAEGSASVVIAARERDAEVAELEKLLARRDAFFAEAENLSDAERSRVAADLAERFENLLLRFPKSAVVPYFYAEFLRDGGENDRAEKMLLRAEKSAPDFVPAQCLLAEILAERGEFAEAFPRFRKAVVADPGNADYQALWGEFLLEARAVLLEKSFFASREELDAEMQSALLCAAVAETDSRLRFDRFWRYAESFYDVENPDWSRALSAWERADRLLDKSRRAELASAVALHRARVFAELGRIDEAYASLRECAGVPALEHSRQKVFEIIKRKR